MTLKGQARYCKIFVASYLNSCEK